MIGKEEDRGKSLLWGLLLALTMVGSGQAVIGRGSRAGVRQANARITLRVYNYAVSPSLLSHAEAEATVILTSANLNPVWVDCPVRHADIEMYPGCNRTIGTADFILKILTRAQSAQVQRRDDELGQALDCPKAEGPCLAYIFYSDLRQVAEAGVVPEFCLLGHVLAHEIGHLLLGPKSHSATGIMQAEWSGPALRTIARDFLFFTSRQSRRMQDEILARRKDVYATERRFQAAVDRGRLTFTLRVYNYGLSRSLLSDAEAEATTILNTAGLDPVWVDCPLTCGFR